MQRPTHMLNRVPGKRVNFRSANSDGFRGSPSGEQYHGNHDVASTQNYFRNPGALDSRVLTAISHLPGEYQRAILQGELFRGMTPDIAKNERMIRALGVPAEYAGKIAAGIAIVAGAAQAFAPGIGYAATSSGVASSGLAYSPAHFSSGDLGSVVDHHSQAPSIIHQSELDRNAQPSSPSLASKVFGFFGDFFGKNLLAQENSSGVSQGNAADTLQSVAGPSINQTYKIGDHIEIRSEAYRPDSASYFLTIKNTASLGINPDNLDDFLSQVNMLRTKDNSQTFQALLDIAGEQLTNLARLNGQKPSEIILESRRFRPTLQIGAPPDVTQPDTSLGYNLSRVPERYRATVFEITKNPVDGVNKVSFLYTKNDHGWIHRFSEYRKGPGVANEPGTLEDWVNLEWNYFKLPYANVQSWVEGGANYNKFVTIANPKSLSSFRAEYNRIAFKALYGIDFDANRVRPGDFYFDVLDDEVARRIGMPDDMQYAAKLLHRAKLTLVNAEATEIRIGLTADATMRLVQQSDRIAKMEEDSARTAEERQAAYRDIDLYKGRSEEAVGRAQRAEGDVVIVTGQLGAAKGKIDSLTGVIDSLQTLIDSLYVWHGRDSTKIQTLTREREGYKAQKDSLQGVVSGLETDKRNLLSENERLTSKLDDKVGFGFSVGVMPSKNGVDYRVGVHVTKNHNSYGVDVAWGSFGSSSYSEGPFDWSNPKRPEIRQDLYRTIDNEIDNLLVSFRYGRRFSNRFSASVATGALIKYVVHNEIEELLKSDAVTGASLGDPETDRKGPQKSKEYHTPFSVSAAYKILETMGIRVHVGPGLTVAKGDAPRYEFNIRFDIR